MASSQPDPLFDGDSDADKTSVASTISLTSTVEENDPEKEYPVEAILAEKDDGEGEGLHCTWEPAANFSDKLVLNDWKDTKMQILRGLKDKEGRKYKNWHAYNVSNMIAFEDAFAKWQKAKKDRHRRRRAKRIKRGLPVETESDTEQEESEAEDDESDAQPVVVPKPQPAAKRRDSKPATSVPTTSVPPPKPVRKGPIPFIQESSGDDDDGNRGVRRPRPRKPPSRPSSPADLTDDSLMGELKKQKSKEEPTRQTPKRKSADASGHSSASTDTRPPKQKSSKLPSQRERTRKPSTTGIRESSTDSDTPLVPNHAGKKTRKTVVDTVDQPKKMATQVIRQLSSSSNVPLAVPPATDKPRVPPPPPSTASAGTNSNTRKKSPMAPPSKESTASSLTAVRPPPGKAPAPAQPKKAVVSSTAIKPISSSAASARTPSGGALASAQAAKSPENPPTTMVKKTTGGGINMNMSAIPPPKKERKPSTREYVSLSHRYNAQKKAAQEGIPDPNALEFINTGSRTEASGTLGASSRKLSSTATPNLYSLRGDEIAALSRGEQTRQEEPTQHILSAREDEKFKEQVTCFDWRCGRCDFGDKCQFLHRDVEFTSNDYFRIKKTGIGRTCWFWWNQEGGCMNPPEECLFAHWNTGTIAGIGSAEALMNVDKFDLPPRRILKSEVAAIVNGPRTCRYWASGICKFTVDHFPFMHRHIDSGPAGHAFERRISLSGVPQDAAGVLVKNTTNQLRFTEPSPAEHMQLRESLPRAPKDAVGSVKAATSRVRFDEPAPPPAMSAPLGAHQPQFLKDLPNIKVRLVLPTSKDGGVNEVDVRFMGLDVPTLDELRAALGANPRLTITHNCSPVDWEAYCLEPAIPPRVTVGDVMPSSASDDALLKTYARSLKRHGDLAGVISSEKYTIIVYPAGQEVWNFLSNFGFAVSPNASTRKLRFNIRSSMPRFGATVQTKDIAKPTDIQTKLQLGLKLDPDLLFGWIDTKLEKNVFMFFTEKNRQEMELVTMCLQGMGAKVFQDVTPGSWDYFDKNTKSGVIIFHPDVYEYRVLPQLRRFLFKRYNFFQIGKSIRNTEEYEQKRRWAILTPNDIPPGQFACIKLFPLGSLMLITDDVFAHLPKEAWNLVQAFMKHRLLKNLPEEFPLSHKLVGRPGLINWLQDLVEKHKGEAKEVHDARVRLSEAFRNELVPAQYIDPLYGDQYVPNKCAQVISWAPTNWPDYHTLWEENPAKATDELVDWFADDICTSEASHYRRFIVCHTFKMSKWLGEYAHLLDVNSPDQCMKRYIMPQGKA
ncbi:uncharacterized protein BDZ99DRAFT_570065 [Mytilinidion resinicola]|uniref:C3H1-type domain-containing protein n=1 Tax=Mytilinidion resinicola TaxID=574789 RepID=A0A6A6YPR4_9PEZI|nr:uncharacterized protein BDZ99DRAFT_570065 [Mytilinidion resinicola]KAF2810741.1 hypothetical protein BDZ99DRAFT_570065 [Mytilinidion resinicola]